MTTPQPSSRDPNRSRKSLAALGVSLGASLAAAVGAAAFNARVGQRAGSLPNLIGGDAGWYDWRGHRVAWTRRGRGPALLLVHSIHAAGWSYEWRHAVDRLADAHAVWTLDLLGFGRSERPALDYSARLYVDLLRDFVAEAIAEPTTVVASSLSGAHAVAAAAGFAPIDRLVLVGATGLTRLSFPATPANDATRAAIDAPLAGQAMFNALVTRAGLRFFLGRTYYDSARVTPALLDAYWMTAHQPGARHAAAAFVGMGLNLNARGALARVRQSMLLTWGRQAREVPLSELDAYRAARPDALVRTFDQCGALPHDERAAEWCAAVLEFTTGRSVTRGAEPESSARDGEPVDGERVDTVPAITAA